MDADSAPPRAPLPIIILAVVFMLYAIAAVIDTVSELFTRHQGFYLDFSFLGIIGFWIGAGLIRGSRRWWTWAYVLTWLGIFSAILGVFITAVLFSEIQASLLKLFFVLEGLYFVFWIWSMWALNKNRWYFQMPPY